MNSIIPMPLPLSQYTANDVVNDERRESAVHPLLSTCWTGQAAQEGLRKLLEVMGLNIHFRRWFQG
jgi:hypothetical protein